MNQITDLTYYEKNRNLILNKAKDYYKNNEERLKEQVRDKQEVYLKKKKIKREKTGRLGITICLKKKKID